MLEQLIDRGKTWKSSVCPCVRREGSTIRSGLGWRLLTLSAAFHPVVDNRLEEGEHRG